MIDVDVRQLEAGAAALEGALDDAVDQVADGIVRDLADDALAGIRLEARRHRRTDRLESRMIVAEVAGHGTGIRATVGAVGRVAPLLVHGARPHAIRPRRARALYLGARGFAESVRHPGLRPDPFVHRGLEDATRNLDDRLDAGAGELAATLAAAIPEG